MGAHAEGGDAKEEQEGHCKVLPEWERGREALWEAAEEATESNADDGHRSKGRRGASEHLGGSGEGGSFEGAGRGPWEAACRCTKTSGTHHGAAALHCEKCGDEERLIADLGDEDEPKRSGESLRAIPRRSE